MRLTTTLFLLLSLLLTSPLLAQKKTQKKKKTCRTCLNQAYRLLEEGNITEIAKAVKPCLKKGSRSEQKEAQLLITESYLFLGNSKKADKAYLEVLKKNPLYTPNFSDDNVPPELVHHADKFYTTPLYSIEYRGGVNAPYVLWNSNIAENGTTQSSYGMVLDFHGGFLVNYHATKMLDLSLGLSYARRSYSFSDNLQYSEVALGTNPPLSTEQFSLVFTERQSWIDIPLMARFNFGKNGFRPFVYIGGAANLLIGAEYTAITRDDSQDVLTSQKYTIEGNEGEEIRNKMNLSAMAGFGAKVQIKRNFLIFDIGYGLMLQDLINTDNVYSNTELVYKYGHVDNNFQFHNMSFTLGFQHTFYKAKKHTKK